MSSYLVRIHSLRFHPPYFRLFLPSRLKVAQFPYPEVLFRPLAAVDQFLRVLFHPSARLLFLFEPGPRNVPLSYCVLHLPQLFLEFRLSRKKVKKEMVNKSALGKRMSE